MPSQVLPAHFIVQSLSLRSSVLFTLPLVSLIPCSGLNDPATKVAPVCPKSKMMVTPFTGFPLGSAAVAVKLKVSEQASMVCFDADKRIELRMPVAAFSVSGDAVALPDLALI